MRADAQRNLDKIVIAAAEVVAEQGVGAPMKLIARRAGVGVGTLYRRFPDRESLIAAIGEHYVESLTEALRRAAERAPDAWSGLRAFVLWAAEEGRGALATALAGLPEDAFRGDAGFARKRREWYELLDRLVERTRDDGTLRAGVVTEDVVALLELFTCHPGDLPSRVAADPGRFLRLMLDGFRTEAAAPFTPPPPTLWDAPPGPVS